MPPKHHKKHKKHGKHHRRHSHGSHSSSGSSSSSSSGSSRSSHSGPGRHHKHDHHHPPHHHDKHKHGKDDDEGDATPASIDVPSSAKVDSTVAAVTGGVAAATLAEPQPLMATYSPVKKKKLPKSTHIFGGEGGEPFNDGTNGKILSVTVRAGKLVDGISILYKGGATKSHGGDGGDEHTLELRGDEYINEVDIRVGKEIQCLTFKTNLGRTLGPAGGSGLGLFGKGKGEDQTITAPNGYMLIGIQGRAGKWLDAVGLHWGPAR